jgi:hypothetical protein
VDIVGGIALEREAPEDEYYEEETESEDLPEIPSGEFRVQPADDVEYSRRVSPEIIRPEEIIPFNKDEFEEF